ncbi:restriction endonuclease subunit S [Companilactobacillus nantensis]|uniref:Type i restriction enzyme specificity protein n=1 Tax=Companilactobacillus nantensis DSM 16982 TaxID=1423774 RepID=A0A0R1WIJ7_9LACO|nr:restriction endonuclease subunit S [Companilactobacillus nantensis]KRM17762.1 type i restriction enzyme specificity protein [Companilactobacillus nantensis DSM 16982]GEO63460.1 hypothetical protein LNA01_06430 [Companilactobacillus nantensis]
MDKRVPEVRFKGFTDDWEQQKSNKIFKPLSKKGFEKLPVLSVTQDDGVIKRSDLNMDIKYTTASLHNYKLIEPHNFVISLRSFQGGFELSDITGVVSPAYTIFSFKENNNQDELFWKYKFKTHNFIQSLKTITFGIRDGKSISFSEFKSLPLVFPNNKKEQKEIGKSFIILEKMIMLEREKLNLYESLKKYMLQNLFPTIEERKSNLIFTSSNTTWKQYYLFDVINKIIDFRGLTPKKLGLDWSKDGILALSALNVKNNYIDKDINIHYGNELLYSKWMKDTHLHKGQVLMTTEAPMGNVAQVPDKNKYILSQRVIAFDTNEQKITDDFLAITLHTTRVFNDLLSLSSGGTAKGVSQRSLSQLKINIPSNIDYQNDISDYYKLLNKKISETQSHLHSYKMLKKYFLQKLFL